MGQFCRSTHPIRLIPLGSLLLGLQAAGLGGMVGALLYGSSAYLTLAIALEALALALGLAIARQVAQAAALEEQDGADGSGDRPQAEAIPQCEAQFWSLGAHTPGMGYRYLPKAEGGGVFTYVSEGCYELFGLEPAQVRQDANVVWALIHPDDLPALQTSVASAVERGVDWHWQGRYTAPSGQLRWLQDSCPQLTPEGLGWDGLLIDVTDLKQTEAALSAALNQEVLYRRALLETSTDGIVILDRAGNVLEANESFARRLGYTPEEVTALNVADFDTDLAQAVGEATVEPHKTHLNILERRHRCRDGSTYDVEVSTSTVAWGKQTVCLCVCRDISRRKQAEAQLRKSEAFYRSLLEEQTELISRFEPNGRLVFVNDAFCQYFGLSRAELEGQSYKPVVYPADQPLIDWCLAALSPEQPVGVVENRVYVRGEVRWAKWTNRAIYDDAGSLRELQSVGRDIDDRKRAELALAASEARFQRLAAVSPAVIYTVVEGPTGIVRFDYLSPVAEEIHEIPVETILQDGALISAQMHPEDRQQYIETYTASLQAMDTFTCEWRIVTPSGKTKWLKASSRPELRPNGEVAWHGITLDVTDRKQAELALQSSQLRLQLALNSSGTGIWDWNLQTNQAVFDKQHWRAFLGCGADETLSDDIAEWASRVHPEDRAQMDADIAQHIEGKTEICESTHRIRCQDGTYKWFLGQGKIVEWDEQGKPARFIGIYRDVNERMRREAERKRVEQTLLQQAQRETLLREITQRIRQSLDIQTIFNTACHEVRACLQADRVGIFKFYPNSGYNDGELVAEAVINGFSRMLATRIRDHCFGERHAALYAQGHYYVVDDIYHHGLEDCHIDLLAKLQIRANLVLPLLCGDRLWGLLCIHQCSSPRHWQQADIELGQQIANQLAIAIQQSHLVEQLQAELAERQQAQQQLTERNQELAVANQDLSRATRLKDEFLANMSHELRTPLNVILGFAQILNSDPSLQPQQRDYIRIMHRSGDHLLHLINDILDLSKIGANCITLEPESIDLFSLLYELQAMFQERAEDKDLTFTLALAPNLPQYIVADPNKLRQVLINLLGNALKFTQTGGIILGVSPQPCEDNPLVSAAANDRVCLRFSVDDTGIGIDPAELTAIFDAFTQAKAGKISLEGTGLGLTISRSLVQLMGGEFTVSSTQGQGSRFCFALPFPRAKPEDVAPGITSGLVIGLAPGQPAYRILVVDDQLENRYLLVAALSQIGLAVQEATDGAEAIARWRQWQPHLIWIDLRMPEIDGCEATRQIRAEAQGLGQAPVIIALTAQASSDERTRALAAGCDDFISKPIQLDLLLTKMTDYLGLRYRYAEPEALTASATAPRLDFPALQVMPPEWIAALHQAALQCDSYDTDRLIQQIPSEHSPLADSLSRLLQEYKFEVIMQFSQPRPETPE